MKIFKLLGMALLSMSVCAGFTSCGGDDEEDFPGNQQPGGGVVPNPDPNPTPNPNPNPDPTPDPNVPNPDVKAKKLVEIRNVDEEQSKLTYKFTYDAQNRLSKMEEIEEYSNYSKSSKAGQSYTTTYDYTWEGNRINIVENDSPNSTMYYTLNNGKIASYDENSMGYVAHWDYAYNGENQLVSWGNEKDPDTYWFNMSWNKGVPQTIVEKPIVSDGEVPGTYTFEYANQTCTGYNPYLYELYSYTDELPAAHPELMGKVVNALPTKVLYKDEDGSTENVTLNYELDNEGYLVRLEYNSVYKDGNTGESETWKETDEYVWQ